MYKQIEIKKGVGGFYINDKYTVYTEKSLNGKIKIYNHLQEIVFLSEQEWINQFSIDNNILLYSSYDENFTRIYNLVKKKHYAVNTYFYGVRPNSPCIYENLYFNLSENDVNYIYDLKKNKIIKQFSNKVYGRVKLNIGNNIITSKESYIFIYSKSDLSLLWQKDLSKLCGYQNDEIRIEEIFNDDTYLYVLVGLSVVKLEISTGNIIWNIPLGTSQSTGLLKDGFLYTTSNATLNKICIKTGKVIYAIFLIDFLLENNYNINGGMRELVWNDNYIWTIMHTYPETILKINPDNGNIEDILSLPELGVTSTALEIQFHKDKLYISDIDGNLHILEKEEAI